MTETDGTGEMDSGEWTDASADAAVGGGRDALVGEVLPPVDAGAGGRLDPAAALALFTGGGGLAGLAEADLARAAAAHTASLTPANTASAYAADWKAWTRFCAGAGFDPLDATEARVVAYAYWLWHTEGAPIATARRRLTGLAASLRAKLGAAAVSAGLTAQARANLSAYAKKAVQAGQRRRGAERGKAAAATLDRLARLVGTCAIPAARRDGRLDAVVVDVDDRPVALVDAALQIVPLADLRDRALLLVGFAAAARRSELAGILAGDIAEEDDGLVVAIRAGKTKRSVREVAVPFGSTRESCPVRAWRRWTAAAGLRAANSAWPRIDRWGHLGEAGMTGEAIGDVVARRAAAAGLAPMTGHSLRRGLATEARRAGRDRVAIARQGGWSASGASLDEYLETVDRWTDNAAAGLL